MQRKKENREKEERWERKKIGKKKDRLGESRTGLRLIKQRTQRRRRQPLDISGLLLLRTSVWDPEWQEAEREREKKEQVAGRREREKWAGIIIK